MQLELGKILKPQGIKGELKVLPLTKAEAISSAVEVEVDGVEAKIEECCFRDGYAFVKLDICKDRNFAETLRDKIISLPSGAEISLSDNEYLFTDLIDCEVYDNQRRYLGKVIDVENYGATDIITIHKDLESIACPFLKDVFFDLVSTSKKTSFRNGHQIKENCSR